MKYAMIMQALMEERWAMAEGKLQAILDLMADQTSGIKYSAEEIEARIGKQTEQDVARQDGDVQILPLRGVIANRMNMMSSISGGTSNEGFAQLFQRALRNDATKAIIIDTDSPGGAVSGTPELSSMIFNARGIKPIIAHVNSTAASAAYWIATAADEIVVTPSGAVGSIGVFGIHDDLSGALEKAGVKKTIIKAGRYKASGHPFGPLDDETLSRKQKQIDAAYDMFVTDIARNRGVDVDKVRGSFGEGDMVDAAEAVSLGMADRVATLEETLKRFGVSQYGGIHRRKSFAPAREQRALEI